MAQCPFPQWKQWYASNPLSIRQISLLLYTKIVLNIGLKPVLVVDTQIFLKVNNTKIVVYLVVHCLSTGMEAMIRFKSLISMLDIFIIVYKSHFERWFIAVSCCGPVNPFKSECPIQKLLSIWIYLLLLTKTKRWYTSDPSSEHQIFSLL